MILIIAIALLLIGAAIAFAKFGTTGGITQEISMFGSNGQIPEVWLPYGLILAALLLLALWILNKILSIPKAIKRSTQVKDATRSREALDNGLLEISSGEFEKGEATLVSHLDGNAGDAAKYLAAAKSADARGARDQADHFLKKASGSSNVASVAVRTTQAEMMIARGEHEKAETLLTNLHHAMPKNAHTMRLLAGVLKNTGNAAKLSSLTQVMRKSGAASEAELADIEGPTWTTLLSKSAPEDLTKAWESLPSEAKTNADAVTAYASKLSELGEDDRAEALVHKAINTNFSDKLAGLYGDLNSSNVAKQLEHAERWMKTNPHSAALNAAVGKLSAKREMWGKARDSLVKSLQLDLNSGVCADLGGVLDSMGESDKAQECYKNAAMIASGKAPVGLMADLPNLASKLADAVGNKAAAVAGKVS